MSMDYIKFDKKAMRNDIKELLDYLCATFLNRMQCVIDEDDNGLYSKIVLVVDENSVVDSIRTSSSVLKFENSSSASGYERKIINEMQKLDDEQKWIANIFYYICVLPDVERHFIIAKYFKRESKEKIMHTLNIKTRTYEKIRSNAYMHLGILIPGILRIRNN